MIYIESQPVRPDVSEDGTPVSEAEEEKGLICQRLEELSEEDAGYLRRIRLMLEVYVQGKRGAAV